jgi:hypothetical protein
MKKMSGEIDFPKAMRARLHRPGMALRLQVHLGVDVQSPLM